MRGSLPEPADLRHCRALDTEAVGGSLPLHDSLDGQLGVGDSVKVPGARGAAPGDDHLLELGPGLLRLSGAAAAHCPHYGPVPGVERVERGGQPVPGPQPDRQPVRGRGLEVGHSDREHDHGDQEERGEVERDGARQAQPEHREREEEEHEAEIDQGEPAVLARGVTEHPGNVDGPPHRRGRVEDQDSCHIKH